MSGARVAAESRVSASAAARALPALERPYAREVAARSKPRRRRRGRGRLVPRQKGAAAVSRGLGLERVAEAVAGATGVPVETLLRDECGGPWGVRLARRLLMCAGCAFSGLSATEIAARLGVSQSLVSATRARCRNETDPLAARLWREIAEACRLARSEARQ